MNANGDVFRPEDAKAILEHTGADGVMVARGALESFSIQADCGIFCVRRISAISLAEWFTGNTPCKMVVEEGEYYGIKEMRKHGAWYIKGMRNWLPRG